MVRTTFLCVICTLLFIHFVTCPATSNKSIRSIDPVGVGTFGLTVVSLIQSFLQGKENDPADGRFIRHANGGCLDGKFADSPTCQYGYCWFTWINPLTTPETNTKWRFIGATLVTYVKAYQKCLGFKESPDSSGELWVGAEDCYGDIKQHWSLKTHLNKFVMVNGERRFFFSIHSQAYPSKCLTIKPRNFYYDYRRNVMRGRYTLYMTPERNRLFLEDCTGCTEQSFFLDTNYMNFIQKVQDDDDVIKQRNIEYLNSNPNECPTMNHFTYNTKGQLKKICLTTERYAVTIEGSKCTGPCQKAGYRYYWCYYYNWEWNYCSPPSENGVDFDRYGQKCRTACRFENSYHSWCDIGTSWEYCGFWIL